MFDELPVPPRPNTSTDREFMDAAIGLDWAAHLCAEYCRINAPELALDQFVKVLRYEAMVTRMTVQVH